MTTDNTQQLTKKNQEFIYIATKQLLADGKTEAEAKTIIEEALPSILDNQAKGITARHSLGAPTAWAASFTAKAEDKDASKQEKNTNPWLMWLDTSLLFTGLIALFNGLMLLFNAKTANSGLFTILSISFGGGAAMYATYHFVYRHMGKPKSERPSWFKSIALIALAMFAWIILISFANIVLPAGLNVNLPYGILFLMSLLAFGVRYFLQKKYNIQSTFAPVQN